mgnify:CR=1 FL=1
MTHEYCLDLEPRNPGLFLACCGLFELADLLAPGAFAWFAESGRRFHLHTAAALPPTAPYDLDPPPDFGQVPYEKALEPLTLHAAGRALTLDWWLNPMRTDKSILKTWGGQQSSRGVMTELLAQLRPLPCADLLQHRVYAKSRFGVDARSAWDALDAGYSPNDFNQPGVTYPWVEVLAVIGLQGFRPEALPKRRFRYAVWFAPLPLPAARAAASAPWPGLPAARFCFELATRGQGYKTFLFAEGEEHE